jgi:hypothetical protein
MNLKEKIKNRIIFEQNCKRIYTREININDIKGAVIEALEWLLKEIDNKKC